MPGEVSVCKIFTFDAAHQLIGHQGKCSNLHGHTYKLEIVLKGVPSVEEGSSGEGFVIDFSEIKRIVKQSVVDRLDHAFLAMGNEPVLDTLKATGSKVAQLSFRTTAENLSAYIAYELKQAALPVYSVKLWETPTSWAEVRAADIPEAGPSYRLYGGCDHE
ncbi:6-carboxytetrahydropterin synthase QueD [Paenibacillus sp. MMS20-IR301]|uniref:6-carboxytetrahydropterin synthase QueD n=1 Tax=Paenibacillus sp. MMS20-IR301 TaxID=2895946 RepID=UPI0028E70C42|nr:6-carboxytetrahydropterin synthase QueD [Paenibacillus sp. MMS20-IR301]WNS45083.1 6-carboxytetrahydropterin synthase QueD [Paenibacillus sp. MMS20-IR301]